MPTINFELLVGPTTFQVTERFSPPLKGIAEDAVITPIEKIPMVDHDQVKEKFI